MRQENNSLRQNLSDFFEQITNEILEDSNNDIVFLPDHRISEEIIAILQKKAQAAYFSNPQNPTPTEEFLLQFTEAQHFWDFSLMERRLIEGELHKLIWTCHVLTKDEQLLMECLYCHSFPMQTAHALLGFPLDKLEQLKSSALEKLLLPENSRNLRNAIQKANSRLESLAQKH